MSHVTKVFGTAAGEARHRLGHQGRRSAAPTARADLALIPHYPASWADFKIMQYWFVDNDIFIIAIAAA